MIKVKTLVEEGRLKVTVSDNGKGIEPEKLQELLGNVQNEASSGTNIGIRNVYRRLELYYEDQVRFDISSVPDEGTIVTFDIPLKLLERKNS